MITFGSVASGIEAASVAFNPIGWRAAWLAEIGAAPNSVLQHHYPNTPNLGDMTKIAHLIRDSFVPAPDVFCGGTPCQAFSVAGLRNSLDDARGNLSLTFCEIANDIDDRRAANGFLPAVIVWENVPGVLSTKDNAFGCFLAGLAGEDDPLEPAGGKWTNAGCVFGPRRTVAWRVLDAQYFGVAQRRRRVFVVASARDGFDPCSVLFEFDGVRRDSAPSRETREETAGTIRASAARRGGVQDECGLGLQPVYCLAHGQGGAELGVDRSPTLTCNHEAPIAFDSRQDCISSTEVFGALGSSSPQAQAVSYPCDLAPTLQAGGNGTGGDRPPGTTVDTCTSLIPVCVTGDITHTLKAEGFDASEDGTGRGQPIVAAYGFQQRIARNGRGDMGDLVSALTAQAGETGKGDAAPCVALGPPVMAVRRLTPRECERLQGFKDDYTLVPGKRKTVNAEKLDRDYLKYLARGGVRTFEECMNVMADGPRYKALGNSWAVPNVAWIGRRIAAQL